MAYTLLNTIVESIYCIINKKKEIKMLQPVLTQKIEQKITPKVTPSKIIYSKIMHMGADGEINLLKKVFDIHANQKNDYSNKQYYPNHYSSYYSKGSDNPDYNRENIDAYESTLADHLIEQLREIYLTEDEWKVAKSIIYNLDENGYLDANFDHIVEENNLEPEDAEEILKMIQNLEPVGCAARTPFECLIVQALSKNKSKGNMIQTIFENHFEDFQKKNYKKISKKTGIPIKEIESAKKFILTLNPKPGLEYSSTYDDYSRQVIPDAIVSEDENHSFSVEENEDRAISTDNYITFKFCRTIVKAIENKQKTIIKICKEIINFQREFFQKGPDFLIPLSLNDLAQKIGVHTSTISRATTNKYIQTKWGTFELKYFITPDTGDGLSMNYLYSQIKTLIKNENPLKPYSDQKISKILAEKGITISRKKVQRYRDDMIILNSSERKKMYA